MLMKAVTVGFNMLVLLRMTIQRIVKKFQNVK